MNNLPEFRKATREDVPFLVDCAHEAYAQYVEAIGKKPTPMTFDFAAHLGTMEIEIIEVSDERVGFLVWDLREDCLFLDNIALTASAQGQGLAKRAIEYLGTQAGANGKGAIELYTNEKMMANLTLYPHLGFIETERRQEHGFNRVYFRKSIC